MADTQLTVALTGASGFVGSHVLRALLDRSMRVRALVRDPSRLALKDARLVCVEGDLFDAQALDRLVQGVDVVVHLVGIIMEKPEHGQTFERVHVTGTQNLIDAADRARVRRWVHMSALGARPDAVARYHQTKWRSEQAVRHSGVNFTIFRPSIIHGPDGEFMRMMRDFWCSLMPPFVPYFGRGLTGKGGAGLLQPVWVDDVARCFAHAPDNPRSVNETYGVGGPDVYTWPELYATVKKHLPKARDKRIVAVPAWLARRMAGLPGVPFNEDQVIMSQEDSTCNIEKLKDHFAFEPVAFEEKFAEYAGQM
jgi:NADH dehydrogenase